MAYRRTLASRAKIFAQQRFSPTFAFTHRDEDRKNPHEDPKLDNFTNNRSFSSFTNSSFIGFESRFRAGGCSPFVHPMMMNGLFLGRHMSTAIGEGGDKIEYMSDVAEVLSDKAVEVVTSQAPVMSEVAIATADSWYPVAALQYVIDGVHNVTGFNWWASIVVTTIMIRLLTLPFTINQLKATSKLTIMRPRLEEIKEEMQNRGMSPSAVSEGQEKMQKIFKEYGVTPWTPLKGLLIQGPVFISFFLAIQNMVEKVPSFKEGGAYMFTDLTTPDTLYILPVVTALTFWIVVEKIIIRFVGVLFRSFTLCVRLAQNCNMQDGMEGNPAASTMKKVSRVFALLTVPLTINFPKAIFCYWITANLYSLAYGLAIKNHGVKKFLNIPIIIPAPPTPGGSTKPGFSMMETIKKYAEAQKQLVIQSKTQSSSPNHEMSSSSVVGKQQTTSSPTEVTKPTSYRIPSSSVLSHRIKSLEKEVKGRKKGKKQ